MGGAGFALSAEPEGGPRVTELWGALTPEVLERLEAARARRRGQAPEAREGGGGP